MLLGYAGEASGLARPGGRALSPVGSVIEPFLLGLAAMVWVKLVALVAGGT